MCVRVNVCEDVIHTEMGLGYQIIEFLDVRALNGEFTLNMLMKCDKSSFFVWK